MNDFTFLTEEQIFKDKKSTIMGKRGTRAVITDFSILLGGEVSDDYHVDNDSSLEGRTGSYWSKSEYDAFEHSVHIIVRDEKANTVRVVDDYGFGNIRLC